MEFTYLRLFIKNDYILHFIFSYFGNMRLKNRRKVRRKYRIKDKLMISKIADLIKNTPRSEIDLRLDAYERDAIKLPSRWVRDAPMEEIMVILTKLGHPIALTINDERNPLKAFELVKASKYFHRTGKLDKLIELAKTHNYFVMTGAQIMKQQDLYSHLVGGTVYKVNPNYKLLLKAAASKNPKDQRVVDEFILNVLEFGEIGEFDYTDWNIIFLIRMYDVPVNTLLIHERLSFTEEPNVIQRHLTRLTKLGYLQKFGLKKLSSYILTGKAWQEITRLKLECFKGIRFFQNPESVEVNEENKIHGSDSKPEAERRVA